MAIKYIFVEDVNKNAVTKLRFNIVNIDDGKKVLIDIRENLQVEADKYKATETGLSFTKEAAEWLLSQISELDDDYSPRTIGVMEKYSSKRIAFDISEYKSHVFFSVREQYKKEDSTFGYAQKKGFTFPLDAIDFFKSALEKAIAAYPSKTEVK